MRLFQVNQLPNASIASSVTHQASLPKNIDKIKNIFQYLKALDQSRNPVKQKLSDYSKSFAIQDIPNHECIENYSFLTHRLGDDEADFIFRISKPELKNCPKAPESILDWLVSKKYNDPHQPPKVEDIKSFISKGNDDEDIVVEYRFSDDPARVKEYVGFLERWNQWAEQEKKDRKAQQFFNLIYELHNLLEKQSEQLELVLGDGILQYQSSEAAVHHPVLLKRCQIVFDDTLAAFSLVETQQPVELHTAVFRFIPGVNSQDVQKRRQDIELIGAHPLDAEATNTFLKTLSITLSSEGVFDNQSYPESQLPSHPRIFRAPVVFVRNRSQGITVSLERILDDLNQPLTNENTLSLPASLLRIVGIDTSEEPLENNPDAISMASGNLDEDVLFSKPANAEQLQIARRLEQHGSVLVQGPPGTGKTHTIANLIGHLLAQGKSVLVTSDKTKALRVVREKVVEDLQPLCVSVLSSDTDSQRQLEDSINKISDRLANSDARQLEQEAAQFNKRRTSLIAELNALQQRLKLILESEYRDIVIDGKNYTPSNAARIIAEGVMEHSWIPGPLPVGEPLPLTVGELEELYETNVRVTQLDEQQLALSLPDPGQLLSPNEFEQLVREKNALSNEDLCPFDSALWSGSPTNVDNYLEPVGTDTLISFIEAFQSDVNAIKKMERWELTLVNAGGEPDDMKRKWERLFTSIEKLCTASYHLEETRIDLEPQLGESATLEAQLACLNEITTHFRNGGKLGWLEKITHRAWFEQIGQWTVLGKPPTEGQHFEALQDVADFEIEKNELLRRWKLQITPLGGPDPSEFPNNPERILKQLLSRMQYLFTWMEQIWYPNLNKLSEYGFNWDICLRDFPVNLDPELGDLLRSLDCVSERLPQHVVAYVHHHKTKKLDASFRQLKTIIEDKLSGGGDKATVTMALDSAITQYNIAQYEQAYNLLNDLFTSQSALFKRRELLKKLSQTSSDWAYAIENRLEVHSEARMPGDPNTAWLWRQLYEELERRDKDSISEVMQRIEALSGELFRTTSALIDRKAWAEQCKRTGLTQRQALQGWRQTIRKIGKGTGKKAAGYQADARKLMTDCRTAVPVWIMPLKRVVENFSPVNTPFDVVIIDEASQLDIMGLITLYMAKQVIVVGDDKQVSPDAVGQRNDIIETLIDEWLDGVPNKHLYDGTMSIYDLAAQSFGGVIMLKEHFRCVPEIIQFSNDLSYEGQIRPLRDNSSVKLKPHWVPYQIQSATSSNKINVKEAEMVAALLIAATKQTEYNECTFGVISLVGEDQALEIEKILRNHMSLDEFHRRKILCGNPANFQGDERDVIFLSMVDAPRPEGGPLRKREFGTLDRYRKRYNVAVSRAKDQIWLVHSLQPDIDLKPGDIRRRLIEHAYDPMALERVIDRVDAKTESEFERQVAQKLMQAGYRVVPQWKVGAYRIDMVVEGNGKRLAVECDGDKYHLDNIEEDMARQAILERLGWTFHRIRGTHYFRDPDKTMALLFQKLQHLDIAPELELSSLEESNLNSGALGIIENEGFALRERITQKAYALLRDWHGDIEGEQHVVGSVKNVSIASVSAAPPPMDFKTSEEAEHSNPITLNECVTSKNTMDLFKHQGTPLNTRSVCKFSTNELDDNKVGQSNAKSTNANIDLEGLLDFIKAHPGLKAKQLAVELNIDKSELNSLLYSLKSKQALIVDEQYQWFVKKKDPNNALNNKFDTLFEILPVLTSEQLATPINELLPDLTRAKNALQRQSITQVSDLLSYDVEMLMKIPNFGQKCLDQLTQGLVCLTLGEPTTHGPLISKEQKTDKKVIKRKRKTFVQYHDENKTLYELFCIAKNSLNEKAKSIIEYRLGFNGKRKTLEEIGQSIGLTRERVRQIEAKSFKQFDQHYLWPEILKTKLEALFVNRDTPFYIQSMAQEDSWFMGFQEIPNVLSGLIEAYFKKKYYCYKIDNQLLVTKLPKDDFIQAQKKIALYCEERIHQQLSKAEIEELIASELNSLGAYELRSLLNRVLFQNMNFTHSDRSESSLLVSIGQTIASYVQVLLLEAEEPLHYTEFHRRYEHLTGKRADIRRVHNALPEVGGLLFGRGRYGLLKHLNLSPEEIHTLLSELESIMLEGEPSYQWHSSELLEILEERLPKQVMNLDKYKISIILSQSSLVNSLARLVWVLRESNIETTHDRVDIMEICIQQLKNSSGPLHSNILKSKVSEIRGLGSYFLLQPNEYIARVSPSVWGLLSRDFHTSNSEQVDIRDQFEALLDKQNKGIHISEIMEISLQENINLPVTLTPYMICTLLQADPSKRFSLSRGQIVSLSSWKSPRRLTPREALDKVINVLDFPADLNVIQSEVERFSERKLTRPDISALLQQSDLIYDSSSNLWDYFEED